MPRKAVYVGLFFFTLMTAVSGFATTLTVSESGIWGPDAPVTPYSAPGDFWSFSFEIPAQPAVLAYTLGSNFQTGSFSDFQFTLNGAITPVTPVNGYITFTSAAVGEPFQMFTAPGVALIPLGPPLYTGPESSPTIVPGSYPMSKIVISGFGRDGTGYYSGPFGGPIDITSGNPPGPVPEDSTAAYLLLAISACLADRFLRHKTAIHARLGR